MAKKVVNPVERIERIALTGDISEPKALTPVENLMGYFPKIPQASGSIAASQPQAKDALKYENTLSQVLPQDAYDSLIQGLNQQSTRFGRLSELGRIAENRLRAPEGTRLFGREQFESKGSLIGSGIDWANNLLRGGAIRRSAFNLLNPSFNGVPARESFVARNPALSAGLTPTALNNLGFYQNQ